MEVFEAILKRRSIRKYLNKPIEEEKIIKILEAARWAPSGGNRQPWRFIIIRNEEKKIELSKIAYNQKFIKEAPLVIAICNKKDESLANIGLAMQNICLEAFDLGLGSCIIGWFNKEEARKFFNIPEEYDICYLITIGYPAEKPTSNRKKLEEIVYEEEWGHHFRK
ncbi:MAG: nitroreductase family protein [Nitrososphaerota archaeon]